MNVKRLLNEVVTYWAPDGQDGYGKATFQAPAQPDGRWQHKSELYRDAEGNEHRSDTQVFLEPEVQIGGYLYRGRSSATDPLTVDGAREVMDVQEQQDLKGRTKLWKAML